MSQINIILRPDSSNDLKKAVYLIEKLWNLHFAKSDGYMKVIFLKYDPDHAKNELKEAREEAEKFFEQQNEEDPR